MRLKFIVRCSHCGNNAVIVPDEADDTDIITCNRCLAALCTIDKFNAKVRAASAEAAAQQLKDAMRGIHKEASTVELEL